MDAAVQELVDRLALRLRRPAVLEDRFLRLIAYSAHDGPVDKVREASILRRHGSVAVSRWMHSAGIRRAYGPVRVPANGDLDLSARICVPVRYRQVLLGHLWFLDAEESVPSDDLDWCGREAAELGTLLHRGSIAAMPPSARVAESLRALLSGSGASAAARRLAEEDLISDEGEIVVAVARLATGPLAAAAAFPQALTDAVLGSPYLCRRGTALHLARKDHSALLLIAPSGQDQLRSQLEVLHAAATADLAGVAPEAAVVIGVGMGRPDLLRASESYQEARLAAMVGGVLPGLGPVVGWSELGAAYQLAAKLAAKGEVDTLLHEGLRPLLHSPEAVPLLHTLETYLDTAGNAQMTAELLHLHRTSLYYRLQRIEALARTDLKDGMERLALHLTLKLARLAGHYLPGHSEQPAGEGGRPA